jgi:hypothetical protein
MAEEKDAYLEQLNKAYIESSSQFDKQVLYIASGALGISLAFIKDIVKLDVATNKNLLLFSWISFGTVILICILSHYTSLKAINFRIENLYQKKDKTSKRFDFSTKLFNVLMIILLAVGLILLNTFIGINI